VSTAQFSVGAVLHWRGFRFADGATADKYLVVLGCKTGHDALLVVATSKRHRKKFNHGCNAADGYHFIPGTGKDFFPLDTWLLLAAPRVASSAELIQCGIRGEVSVCGKLRDQLANEIRNCLKRVKDVSAYHVSLL
jgi:hypothetical protein